MNVAPDNAYGWTHYGAIIDIADQPTLKQQIRTRHIPYTETELNMGSGAGIAYVITYLSPTRKNVVVLVVPQIGTDTWYEEYYYFVGLDARMVLDMDWYELLGQMQMAKWDDMKRRAQHPTVCLNCGHFEIWTTESFNEGDRRCPQCNNPK